MVRPINMSNSLENNEKDLIKAVFEQHWLHARHVENERLWLTNIYAVILAGSLAYMKEDLFKEANLPLICFLMLLSLFCILFCLKIDSIFKTHTTQAENLLKESKIPFLMLDGFSNHWVNKVIRISRLFPIFFSLCFNFLLFIFLKILFGPVVYSYLIPFAIFFLSSILFYRIRYEKSDDEK